MTVEKVELGRRLYYDERVASQPSSSCADCHLPDHGLAGRSPTMAFHRNSPTVWNRAYGDYEFWDGSAGQSLEELTDGVLRFVNLGAKVPVAERLAAIAEYRRDFQLAFGRPPDRPAIVQAIACYCRTLLAGNSPFDRFSAGDKRAMTVEAQRGRDLFFGKAGCVSCHTGPNFTDELFHDIGIGQEDPQKRFYSSDLRGKPDFPELGRFNLTHRLEDRGAFKTPTLRELDEHRPLHARRPLRDTRRGGRLLRPRRPAGAGHGPARCSFKSHAGRENRPRRLPARALGQPDATNAARAVTPVMAALGCRRRLP